jgi:hypothetical protein
MAPDGSDQAVRSLPFPHDIRSISTARRFTNPKHSPRVAAQPALIVPILVKTAWSERPPRSSAADLSLFVRTEAGLAARQHQNDQPIASLHSAVPPYGLLNLLQRPPDPDVLGISGPSLQGSVTRRTYSAVVALLPCRHRYISPGAGCRDRSSRIVSRRSRHFVRPNSTRRGGRKRRRPPFQGAFESRARQARLRRPHPWRP